MSDGGPEFYRDPDTGQYEPVPYVLLRDVDPETWKMIRLPHVREARAAKAQRKLEKVRKRKLKKVKKLKRKRRELQAQLDKLRADDREAAEFYRDRIAAAVHPDTTNDRGV